MLRSPNRATPCVAPGSPLAARLRAAAVALAVVLAPAASSGAETQWWVVDSARDHAEAELRGVVVRPEGAIELGPSADSTPTDSLSTIWAIALLRDGSVALGGDDGLIARWTPRDGIRPWVRLPVGQVFSLATDGEALLAGTGPDGWIYRIGARGDTTMMARTGERYVWGLAPGRKGVWFAATGTRGRLLRIEDGRVKIVLDTEESNLVSIVSDGANGVYAGGDSRGLVVHVSDDGMARTVYDAAEDEVRALALGADGAVYAAGLSTSAVYGTDTPSAETPGDDEKDSAAEERPSRPAPLRAPTTGRSVVYRIVPDSSVTSIWSAPQPLVYALARAPQGIVAATGNRAGVYALEPGGGVQWLAAPQGQITALAVARDGRVYAAASNPAALWRLGPGRAEQGELISDVFDARNIARWGRVVWRGENRGGRVELSTRSGNTEKPDTTWTPWQRAGARDRVASVPGRFLQWRLVLAGGEPRVESVETSWREQNQPPRVEDIAIAPQGQAFREGELLPRPEPVTQTLPSGQKVEYSVPAQSGPRALRDLPVWARGIRTVQWKATDPNGDPLRFRVEVGRSLEGPWIRLGEDEEGNSFSWDTSTLPDGRYRLRVTATDAPGNAVGEERTGTAMSEPFTADNTPPVMEAWTATGVPGGIRIEGSARDESSPLWRIEATIDDGEPRAITPDGGFADDLVVSFRATLGGLEAGEHAVGLRVVDRAGNSTLRALRVTVPARR